MTPWLLGLMGAQSELVPRFIGTTTFTASSTQNHSVPVPSGAQDGDLLLCFVALTSARVVSPPAGWDEVYSAGPATTPSGRLRGYCFSRLIEGTPPSTYTFQGSSTFSSAFRMLCFRPSRSITVLGQEYSTGTPGGPTYEAPSVFAAESALLLCAYFLDTSSSANEPSGFDDYYPQVAGDGKRLLLVGKHVDPGNTGSQVATGPSCYWNAGSTLIHY